MQHAVVAEGVRRTYGDTVALDGVDLTVGSGEVFGLIGPNGAGKTTLIRALTGTTDAEGRVEVLGATPEAVDRERIGLLPQEFGPPERLTARELVEYYGGLYEESRSVESVLADVGLSDDAETWYENLSGGQKRRACVATALVNDPELLVLDEPTTGIDPAGRRALWSLLERLAEAGTTVLLTTHYMEEAETLADRVGLLADGELVATGTPAELVAAHGGEPRLEIAVEGETTRATTALDAAGYATVETRRGLAVTGIAAREVGEVAAVLDDDGIAYGALAWTQPDLEDVYLALTGTGVGSGGEPVEREDEVHGGTGVEPAASGEGGEHR
ncbi:ABC transporter ATP-binding protein [Salinirubellus sp. GCM10025818]|jgi:ABC-2 type transport system ATP-binding protein|uniref:ABC transporter ATP-binding protein n=1 Tax=Salinirubellus TaxID=2162630 RepID=UPI0030CE07FE